MLFIFTHIYFIGFTGFQQFGYVAFVVLSNNKRLAPGFDEKVHPETTTNFSQSRARML